MVRLETVLNDINLALLEKHVALLESTRTADKIFLQNNRPTKEYFILKLALIEISQYLNGDQTSTVFGQTLLEEDERGFSRRVKTLLEARLDGLDNLATTFGVENQGQVEAKTRKGLIRELLESLYPFTDKIKSISDPTKQKALKAVYEQVRDNFCAELEKTDILS